MESTISYTPVTRDGTVTSWIPMDTGWAMPTGCSSLYRYNFYPFDGPELIAFDPSWGRLINSSYSCQPPAASSWFLSSGQDTKTVTTIMPLTCPDGWATATMDTVNSDWLSVQCCPSGYKLYQDNQAEGIDCTSGIEDQVILTYESYLTVTTGSNSGQPISTEWTMVTTQIEVTSAVGAIAINGYAIATSTTSSGAKSSSSSPSDSSSVSGGLSSAAKTVIGVGVGVGTVAVIAIAAAIWFFIWRWKTKTKAGQTAELETFKGPSELHSHSMAIELGDRSMVTELDGKENVKSPVELPDNRASVEQE